MKYNKFVLGAVLLLAIQFNLLAGPPDPKVMVPVTPPSDAGFYVEAGAGAFFSDADKGNTSQYSTNQKFERSCRTYTVTTVHTQHSSTSSDIGAVASLDGGYNFASIQTPYLGISLQPGVQIEGVYKTNNNYDGWAGLVNGTLGFRNSTIVTPYIGVGCGFEYTSGVETGLHPAVDGEFGLQEQVAQHWAIFEQYQCIVALAPTAIFQHDLEVGVRYSF